MSSYRERVEALAPRYADTGSVRRSLALEIAADADARVAELEAVLHATMVRAELTLEASDGHGARLTLADTIEDIRAALAGAGAGATGE